ncbi:glycosyltransferase family 2 protein [Natrarchaeobaculum sulfurireducens]|uniref:Glycosyl transferase family 2 n=1 Tax=Natrarchaeobaculum sulfurireducens TaxID=2044521 RepID=A0A346PB16_9EURY|nr:glycosyltransferase family 2 protein [Natrarchaeobaculum sulfurireducens]AXR76711.1 Glycosyl transferase family 2 [Natrarchaeobaculum sulfurireducens]
MIDLFSMNAVVTGVVILLWVALVLYGFSALWWAFEVFVLGRGGGIDPEEVDWELSDIQVRVLTIDNHEIVQATVDALPEEVDAVHVIAETPMEIEGASVHVVPASFECKAINKGRAVEWARRTLPCQSEYVLYLDEDTIVTDFNGLPDADVVQFTEKPIYTGSYITYLCELFRVGYQFEQFAFPRLRYPLYAWGGGVAIRASLEEQISWDRATITEDTNFIWNAAKADGVSFAVYDTRFRNQAPPSVRAMINQRRRWISGTIADGHLLPITYRPLYYTRIIAWAFSPVVPALVVIATLFPHTTPSMRYYELLSIALFGFLFVYMLFGAIGYDKHPLLWPVYVLVTPVAFTFHAIGALWGLVRPVTTFEVTEKVAPETVVSVNDALEEDVFSEHDGTGRLIRDDRSEYDTGLIGDGDAELGSDH